MNDSGFHGVFFCVAVAALAGPGEGPAIARVLLCELGDYGFGFEVVIEGVVAHFPAQPDFL